VSEEHTEGRQGLARLRGLSGVRLALVVALLAVAVAFPVIFPSPVDALIFVAVASAWNIFSELSGYISLGHAVFFGSGAYTLGIAARDWHVTGTAVFALLPLAAVAGALIAVPFGLVALRVRRHTFIVITIALFFIFQLMAFHFSFTGGTTGLDAPFLPWAAQTCNNPFYYIALACAVATIALAWLIRRSRFGLQLRAIRDDEDRARGLGVHAMRVKLTALVLSGAITALVGAVWFFYLTQVEPQSGFDPLFDLSVVLMGVHKSFGGVRALDTRTIEVGEGTPSTTGPGHASERSSSLSSWASRAITTRWPGRCPTVSESCSSSPTCWSRTRLSSCSTSRPAASTCRWSTRSRTASAS
jgi:branched-chain amino acid transport system permease protein